MLAMDIIIFDFILKQIYTMIMFSTLFHPKTRDEIHRGGFLQKNILYFKELFILPFFTRACWYMLIS